MLSRPSGRTFRSIVDDLGWLLPPLAPLPELAVTSRHLDEKIVRAERGGGLRETAHQLITPGVGFVIEPTENVTVILGWIVDFFIKRPGPCISILFIVWFGNRI